MMVMRTQWRQSARTARVTICAEIRKTIAAAVATAVADVPDLLSSLIPNDPV